jgi:hypothetical protein
MKFKLLKMNEIKTYSRNLPNNTMIKSNNMKSINNDNPYRSRIINQLSKVDLETNKTDVDKFEIDYISNNILFLRRETRKYAEGSSFS